MKFAAITLTLVLSALGSALCQKSAGVNYYPCSDYIPNQNDLWHPPARLWGNKDIPLSWGLGWKSTQVITTNGKNPVNYAYMLEANKNTGEKWFYAGPASLQGLAPEQEWRVDVHYENDQYHQYLMHANMWCRTTEWVEFKGRKAAITSVFYSLKMK
jgi:hypothetical protein